MNARARQKTGGKSREERGYGLEHKRKRAEVAPEVATGYVKCWRCGRLIDPSEPWDLGHDDDDRSVYRGPEHAKCNRRAGAKNGARARNRKRKRATRVW